MHTTSGGRGRMAIHIRRRDFITLIGGSVAAWPLTARAQQDRIRRIGVVTGTLETDPDFQARYAVLRQALQQLGWTEGRNIQFEHRFGSAGNASQAAHYDVNDKAQCWRANERFYYQRNQ